jgi:phosphoribosylformylglycinamidine synthase subunit PurQ / glutaminase
MARYWQVQRLRTLPFMFGFQFNSLSLKRSSESKPLPQTQFMKFGILVFPGSNCDHDMEHVLGTVMGAETQLLWHKDKDLGHFTQEDCIVLPGGFSYGDYLRCGAIARFSPLMQEVIKFANKGGKVLGICNGFQILCEAGLLPGVLLRNDQQLFQCKNVNLRVENTHSNLTSRCQTGEVLTIPIAHAEGRYYANPEELERLEANQQVLFRYCDESGNLAESSNPNGSLHHIAGICNASRNVFGMMPHPERAAEEILGNIDGLKILEGLYAKSAVHG